MEALKIYANGNLCDCILDFFEKSVRNSKGEFITNPTNVDEVAVKNQVTEVVIYVSSSENQCFKVVLSPKSILEIAEKIKKIEQETRFVQLEP